MVWRAGGGGPMRRCISSTGNLYAYSYPNEGGNGGSSSNSNSNNSGGGGHSPIPIARAGTPPVMGMGIRCGSFSTSPGSLHAFHSVMTPPMNSPRGAALQPMAPFERTWGDDVVRVVCISDTHSRHDALLRGGLLPPGDVLVHAGDFSTTGTRPQVENFRDFLKTVPYAHKVVVGGNHDITLHESYYEEAGEERFHKNRPDGPYFPAEMRRMLMNLEGEFGVRYLENDAVEVMGISFWGTPWTPYYGGWAFNYEPEGEFCRELYAGIPEGVDVLITHGPPAGVGDLTVKGVRAGCPVLLNEVRTRIRPRTHVFGHIHEGYGAYEDELGWTRYCNASTSTVQYRPINPPLVFDVPLDKALPARWVSVADEEVTRLDLHDGVGRPPLRRRESAFSLASTASNNDLLLAAAASSAGSSASSSSTVAAAASAAAALATAALIGGGNSSSSSTSTSTSTTDDKKKRPTAISVTSPSGSPGPKPSGGGLPLLPPRSPASRPLQRPAMPGRTQSLPPAISGLTAGLAAAAASAASGSSPKLALAPAPAGAGAGARSQPIVVPGAERGAEEEEEELLTGSIGQSGMSSTVGVGGGRGHRGRDRSERDSIGDSSSCCSGSLVTAGTGTSVAAGALGMVFTPSSSLDLEVEVAERFMSLRVQGQHQQQGQQGQGQQGESVATTTTTTVMGILQQRETHAHMHVHMRGGGEEGAHRNSSNSSGGAGGGGGEGERGRQEGGEEGSHSPAPSPAPVALSSTPPLSRFAIGRRLR